MAAKTYNKFQQFVEDLSKGVHNLSTGSITVALCAAAHAPVATNKVLADLTEIAYTYCSSRVATVSSCAQTGGTLKLILADLTLTASGGAVGPFEYLVFYNATPTNPLKPLICWYDYGSEITLADGESLLIDLDNVNGILQIA